MKQMWFGLAAMVAVVASAAERVVVEGQVTEQPSALLAGVEFRVAYDDGTGNMVFKIKGTATGNPLVYQAVGIQDDQERCVNGYVGYAGHAFGPHDILMADAGGGWYKLEIAAKDYGDTFGVFLGVVLRHANAANYERWFGVTAMAVPNDWANYKWDWENRIKRLHAYVWQDDQRAEELPQGLLLIQGIPQRMQFELPDAGPNSVVDWSCTHGGRFEATDATTNPNGGREVIWRYEGGYASTAKYDVDITATLSGRTYHFPMTAIGADLVALGGTALAAPELYNSCPQVELLNAQGQELTAADIAASGATQRAFPVAGKVHEALFPVASITANTESFALSYPQEFTAAGLLTTSSFSGSFAGELRYSRSLDVPIVATATNAVMNTAFDEYDVFLQRRYGIFELGTVSAPSPADPLPWGDPERPAFALHPGVQEELVYVLNRASQPVYPDGRTLPPYCKVRFTTPAGFTWSESSAVELTLGDGFEPKAVHLFAGTPATRLTFETPFFLLHDELTQGPQSVTIANVGDVSLDGLKLKETIAAAAHSVPLAELRLKARLGFKPLIKVSIGENRSGRGVWERPVAGIRVLNAADQSLLSEPQPLAGAELRPWTDGADPRDKFIIQAFKATATGDTLPVRQKVTVEYRDEFRDDRFGQNLTVEIQPNDSNHRLGVADHLGDIVLQREASGIYQSDTTKPCVLTVSPFCPETDDAGTVVAEPGLDPNIQLVLVKSGAFLPIAVAGLTPVLKHVKRKAYLTMGDSLTAGIDATVLVQHLQEDCHGKHVARQMGLPFSISGFKSAKGFTGVHAVTQNTYLHVRLFDVVRSMFNLDAPVSDASSPGHHSNVGISGYDVLSLLTNADQGIGAVQSERGNLRATLPKCAEFRTFSPYDDGTGDTKYFTPMQSAIIQAPSLIACWIGANDALGAVISGDPEEDAPTRGASESVKYRDYRGRQTGILRTGSLTRAERFAAEYGILVQQLKVIQAAFGTDFLLANVPNANVIPLAMTHLNNNATPIGVTPFGHEIEFNLAGLPVGIARDVTAEIAGSTVEIDNKIGDSQSLPGNLAWDMPESDDRVVALSYAGILALLGSGQPGALAQPRFLRQTAGQLMEPYAQGATVTRIYATGFGFFTPPASGALVLTRTQGAKVIREPVRYSAWGRNTRFHRRDSVYSFVVAHHMINSFNANDLCIADEFNWQLAIDHEFFITQKEFDRIDQRIKAFNQSIDSAVGKEWSHASLDAETLFDFVRRARARVTYRDDTSTVTHTLTLEMMGGLFSGDGIHPLISGYAFAADHMIQALNVQIKYRRDNKLGTFGGFVHQIPVLDNPDSTDDLVSRIAERDELFKRTIRKAALGGN